MTNLLLPMFAFLIVATLTNVNAQSTAPATISVNIISPVSIEGAVQKATLSNDINLATIKIFPEQSSQKFYRSSFLFPLIKKQITFANLKISDATLSCYNISLPTTVTLKNRAETKAITAYSFSANRHQNVQSSSAISCVELSAMVAITTDQFNEAYVSGKVDVAVNYN
jgi:hypothetical protein